MSIFKTALSLTFSMFFLSATANTSGKVFLDKNKNGKYDKGEKLLKNIVVSNGFDLVKTNSKGEYNLEENSKAKFVFITIPSGYRTTKKFYVDINSDNKDFGLIKYNRTKKDSKFIQITDTETFEYGDWIDNLRDYSKNNDIGFIIHTGDICYVKGLKFHAKNVNTETMGLPVFYGIGNHDLVQGKYGEELFESLFGPVYYSFNAGNTHYIVTPMAGGDHRPSYTRAQVLDWVKKDLELVDKKMNLVIFNHDLLTYNDEFVLKARGKKDLYLNEHNLKAWIYGHWHINFLKKHGKNGPISVCASTPDKGGINHSPSNFIVYDVSKKGEVKVTPIYTYVHNSLAVNYSKNEDGSLKISANTYSSVSKAKNVKATIIFNNKIHKSVSLNQNSDWNWSADVKLNEKQKVADIKISVETIFEDKSVAEKSIDIEKNATPIKWINNSKGNLWMASPLVVNNKVYIASIDDFKLENCGIKALDKSNGKVIWEYKTKGSVKNTICYGDNKIFATDVYGIAYAIDADSGKLIWTKNLGQKGLGAYNSGGIVKDGVYYTGFGNYLQAIDIKNAKTLWTNTGWSGGEGATSHMIVEDGVLITASNWRALYAHDAKTGKLLWQKSDHDYRFRSSNPNFVNGKLYVASQKGIGIIDIHTGELLNYIETKYNLQSSTTPLVIGNTVIMGTAKNGVVAFDFDTKKELWHTDTKDAIFYTSPYTKRESKTVETAPILIKGNIVIGASDGYIYIINPKNGKIIEKTSLGAPILSDVTPTEDGFIVNDFGGSVYFFKP